MILYEGANTNIGIDYSKLRINNTLDKAEFKKAINEKDYNKARMYAVKISKNCDDFYDYLDKMHMDAFEAAAGTIAHTAYDIGKDILFIYGVIEATIKGAEVLNGGRNLTKSQKQKVRQIASSKVLGDKFQTAITSGVLEDALKIILNISNKAVASKNIEAKDLNSYYITIKRKVKVICAKAKLLINDVDRLQKVYGAEERRQKLEQDLKDAKNVLKESEDSDRVSKPWFIKASDNSINACVKIKGYNKPFRARSSMLIIKDIDTEPKVYFSYSDKDKEYHAPGGGWNEKEEPIKAAMREAKEECHINVKIVKPFGERLEYYDEVRDWVKDHVDNPDDYWYGYYSKIFVGQYGSKYNGHVNDEDEDPEINSGKFYNFEDIKDKIYPEYRKAIEDYLNYWNKTVKESEEAMMDKDLLDVVVESNINENTESDPEILAVYKECAAGNITEDQRESLINTIKAQRSASVMIKEASGDDQTLKERYNEVKKIAYERCAAGEFSVETRDNIIKEAFNKIFNEEAAPTANDNNTTKEDPELKKDIADVSKKIETEMNKQNA